MLRVVGFQVAANRDTPALDGPFDGQVYVLDESGVAMWKTLIPPFNIESDTSPSGKKVTGCRLWAVELVERRPGLGWTWGRLLDAIRDETGAGAPELNTALWSLVNDGTLRLDGYKVKLGAPRAAGA